MRLTGTLTVAGAALLLAAACGDGGAYVRENERLLETLPEMPGSQRLEGESSPYYLGDDGPVDGYTTNVVYRAPPETTAQEVIDFYVRSLEDDWEYELEEVPIIELPSEVPWPPFPDASPRPVAPGEEPGTDRQRPPRSFHLGEEYGFHQHGRHRRRWGGHIRGRGGPSGLREG